MVLVFFVSNLLPQNPTLVTSPPHEYVWVPSFPQAKVPNHRNAPPPAKSQLRNSCLFLGSSHPVVTSAAIEEAVRSAAAATLQSSPPAGIVAQRRDEAVLNMESDDKATIVNQPFVEDLKSTGLSDDGRSSPDHQSQQDIYVGNEGPPLNRVRFFLPNRSFELRSSLTTSSGNLDANDKIDITMMEKQGHSAERFDIRRQDTNDSIVLSEDTTLLDTEMDNVWVFPAAGSDLYANASEN